MPKSKWIPRENARDQQNAIDEAIRTLLTDTSESCPGCGDFQTEVVDKELATLRVEFVKQQILKKLKLKEVPKVTLPRNKLPIPILTKGMYHGLLNKNYNDANFQVDDDFFGKTNQVILFPEEYSACESYLRLTPPYPSACFTFQLPKDLEMEDLALTDFWIYKEKDFLDGDPNVNQTLVYSEILEVNQINSPQILVIERHGWIKLDILETVKKWLEQNIRRHTIQVMCKTCGYMRPWTPVSLKTEKLPFLVINTENNKKKRRPKRNVNCMPGISECCREKLYISFVDIGWNEWIIQPRGYDAYFCRGSCSNAASLTLSGGKKVELVPCCTATHLSPIQLIYMDNNETITQKTLPNMVVDACGCM
ncbi:Growth/differentiation factor 8 precursor, putative [Pediculus humanus corporis]|uniref:Growth/differentiation factor 8, putative n=1 Tax=Pediculus humanus subsp. corporis TaxID=121224 RepID=E0VAB4_PEDHC|nr:Growth/differentiation factor 8 precursor, putative [Pediculus humanus corporis]EEB10320.1 Growth/differentiation factor 8 precursor, putative [Pediculus humanus corporis]